MSDAASPPIYQQIAGMLRREIAGGQLVVGQPLAPERQPAKQFGVSVVTLRKALQLLTDEGMLRRRQGSGNYVGARRPGTEIRLFPDRNTGRRRLADGTDTVS